MRSFIHLVIILFISPSLNSDDNIIFDDMIKDHNTINKSSYILEKNSSSNNVDTTIFDDSIDEIENKIKISTFKIEKKRYHDIVKKAAPTKKYIKNVYKKTKKTIGTKEKIITKKIIDLQSTNTITLKNSIIKALKNSYKIQAAKEKVEQAKRKVDEKLAAYLPKIDLYANAGGSYLKPYQAPEVKFLKSDESLVITQNIYAGSKHINEVKRERANLKATIDKYRDKVEEESLKVIDAFLSVIYEKKAINKANENMQNLKKILDIVTTKEYSGAASKGDLNYIKSQVENASAALVKVKSKYKNALSFFEYYVGKIDEKNIPKEENFSFKLEEIKKVLDKAYNQNAKLQISRYRLKAEKYNLKAQKSKYRPKIDLSITGKDKQSGYISEPQEDRAVAMLQFSFNLYNGGKDKAQILGVKSKIRELEYRYLDTKKGIKQNTEQLYETVSSSLETLSHTKEEVKANKKVIDSYWSAFKYGSQDLQALLLAQRALNRSELDEIKQKQTYINSYFKLLQQTGELLDSVKIKSL